MAVIARKGKPCPKVPGTKRFDLGGWSGECFDPYTDGKIWHRAHKLADGRALTFFVNFETNLVVVDVVDKDEKGGREILRRTL